MRPCNGPIARALGNTTSKWSEGKSRLYPCCTLLSIHIIHRPSRCWTIARLCGGWGVSEMSLHLSSSTGGAWLEAKATMKPALISALCSVTSKIPWPIFWWCQRSPANLGALRALSSEDTPEITSFWLVWDDLSRPFCRSDTSFQRSATSKRVIGTQSLSSNTTCTPGKRNVRAANTKVPAHVGWTCWSPAVWSIGMKRRSHSSRAGPCIASRLSHHASTVGQCARDSGSSTTESASDVSSHLFHPSPATCRLFGLCLGVCGWFVGWVFVLFCFLCFASAWKCFDLLPASSRWPTMLYRSFG